VDRSVVQQHVEAPEGVDCRIDDVRPVGLARDVVVDGTGGVAELRGDRSELRVEDVGEHDLRALGDEAPRLALTHAAGGAGDDRDLSRQTTGHPASPSFC
jgi:hypothetical protein